MLFFVVAGRIRLAIIQQIPLLAKQLGKDFFTEKLSSLWVGWLGDDIAVIRRAAATNVKVCANAKPQSNTLPSSCFLKLVNFLRSIGINSIVWYRLGNGTHDSFSP